MKTTIGGDRLGSGSKQEVSMRNYERSTHDLGYNWRSSMSAGTLVPFMSTLGLPGDSFDIDLQCEVMTLPTIGPLFGSYKIQLDIFVAPIRLYQAKLHMNLLGIGLDMASIKLPQAELLGVFSSNGDDNQQINPSCIWSYLGVRGLGRKATQNSEMLRQFNAVPYLAYWEIYKNYYANKQEENAYVIHASGTILATITAATFTGGGLTNANMLNTTVSPNLSSSTLMNAATAALTLNSAISGPSAQDTSWKQYLKINVNGVQYPLDQVWTTMTYNGNVTISCSGLKWESLDLDLGVNTFNFPNNQSWLELGGEAPVVTAFPLANIDTMRKNLLADVNNAGAYLVSDASISPYGLSMGKIGTTPNYYAQKNQEGLALKTYQSDLFNNWISTEWIDGANGINEITKVSTTGDEFTIDALNLANKVYNMLNRIAISGGSYDDWLDATYTQERAKSVESPIYYGSLIKELAFQEVINTSGQTDQPLGTLAGRGRLTSKHKGGSVKINIQEPSYVMGIVSITPRVDYSQGNQWDMNLKTLDDLHKPALDEIGYQDLITDQLAWWDTTIDNSNVITFNSAGKQPAWINYMTEVNKVRGNFADQNKEMFMTLNRRYEFSGSGVTDLTTYIDPTKFNQIFADTSLDSQNFWVQIGVQNIARRKMSAKVIPNL